MKNRISIKYEILKKIPTICWFTFYTTQIFRLNEDCVLIFYIQNTFYAFFIKINQQSWDIFHYILF